MADQDLINLFEEQFVRAGDRWIFRARRNGPAIEVSDTERDLFVTGFSQALAGFSAILLRYGLGSYIALFAAALLFPQAVATRFGILIWGFGAFWACLRAMQESTAFAAPAMALADRRPVAPPAEPASRVYEISKDIRLKFWPMPAFMTGMWFLSLTSTSDKRVPDPLLFITFGGIVLTIWLATLFKPKMEMLRERWTL